MNVVVLGATGMVGQGVLHACLRDEGVEQVTVISRRPLAVSHPKLQVLLHQDFRDLNQVASTLGHVDACYFCIGVPSAGQTEEQYTEVTLGHAVAAAEAFLPINPDLTFVYVSGGSANSESKVMWQRVKGRAEQAILDFPFHSYVFRPGYIRPANGVRPPNRGSRIFYGATSWLYPVLVRLFPNGVTSTDAIGRAMLAVSRLDGKPPHILASGEINQLAVSA